MFDGLQLGSYDLRTDAYHDRVKSIIIKDRMWPGRLSTHGYWAKPGYKKYALYYIFVLYNVPSSFNG